MYEIPKSQHGFRYFSLIVPDETHTRNECQYVISFCVHANIHKFYQASLVKIVVEQLRRVVFEQTFIHEIISLLGL